MNIVGAFERAFREKAEHGWEKIYVLVDVHDTIMVGEKPERDNPKWYAHAIDALRMMTEREDICLIMWTGAYPLRINKYKRLLAEMGVRFDYENENPEAESNDFYCSDSKVYFNVGIDDRFGFDAESDWKDVVDFLQKSK